MLSAPCIPRYLSSSLSVIHFIGVHWQENVDNKSDKTDRKFDKKHRADKMNKKQAAKEDDDEREGNKNDGGRRRRRREEQETYNKLV